MLQLQLRELKPWRSRWAKDGALDVGQRQSNGGQAHIPATQSPTKKWGGVTPAPSNPRIMVLSEALLPPGPDTRGL